MIRGFIAVLKKHLYGYRMSDAPHAVTSIIVKPS